VGPIIPQFAPTLGVTGGAESLQGRGTVIQQQQATSKIRPRRVSPIEGGSCTARPRSSATRADEGRLVVHTRPRTRVAAALVELDGCTGPTVKTTQ
jgi:hypothetical protein